MCECPPRTRSTPAASRIGTAFWRISVSVGSVSESWLPRVYGGWCQNAMIQSWLVAARSSLSQVSIAPPGLRGESYESRTTKWTLP
jgi:hypothetical protein